MAIRTRYRRKVPSSPEVQGLFFDKAQTVPAFFNPTHQTSDRSNSIATSVVQRQEGAIAPLKPEEEKPVQKQVKQEEEKPIQKQTKEEEAPVQKQNDSTERKSPKLRVTTHPSHSDGEQEQITGLPDRLKTSVEKLSGMAIDDVKVHYNSPKPAQMRALAYTQGTDIYLAPGQEKHLPHEVWHVVQQKQGRVKPTMQAKGVGVNDNPGLEREATVMGEKANVR